MPPTALTLLLSGMLAASLAVAQGPVTAEAIVLAGDRLRADRWVADTVGDADMRLLMLAVGHQNDQLRALAVREFGRLETPHNIPLLAKFLDDSSPAVRQAAAEAMVQSLVDRPDALADAVFAINAIELRLLREGPTGARGPLWVAIAELPLGRSLAKRLEREWVTEIQLDRDQDGYAAEALLRLFRSDPTLAAEAQSREAVYRAARAGLRQGASRSNLRVLLDLLEAMDADLSSIAPEAAAFVCRGVAVPCGHDVRDFGVRALQPGNPGHVFPLELAARNTADPVAANLALRALVHAPDMPLCRLVDLAEGMAAEGVVLQGLATARPARYKDCLDWDPVIYLMARARALVRTPTFPQWVVPVAALEALARRAVTPDMEMTAADREAVRRMNADLASRHPDWQVRVAAARVAGLMDDVLLLATLALDEHPNVVAAVIRSLVALRSSMAFSVAFDALERRDAGLLRTAADALAGAPRPAAARELLMVALEDLTDQARDADRRARLALLRRIGATLNIDAPDLGLWLDRLRPLLSDPDHAVADAAASVIASLSGSSAFPRPAPGRMAQPAPEQVAAIPPCLAFTIEGTTREAVVVLDRQAAPVAVARLVALVNGGYYNGTHFHAADGDQAIGGNPAANDDGGLSRFMRDEVVGRRPGVVLTLAAHDRDAADGRLRIRFRDDWSAARRETVVGRFVAIEPIIAGARITRVRVGAPEPYLRDVCHPTRLGIAVAPE